MLSSAYAVTAHEVKDARLVCGEEEKTSSTSGGALVFRPFSQRSMPKDIQLAPIFLPSTDPRVHSTPKEHPDEPPPSRRNRLVLALLVFLFSALLLSRDTSRYFLDLPSRDKSPPTSSDMSGIPRPNGKVS